MNKIQAHKKIARITFPIWMYVSVTGVIVYLFLYVLFPEHTSKELKIKDNTATEHMQPSQ